MTRRKLAGRTIAAFAALALFFGLSTSPNAEATGGVRIVTPVGTVTAGNSVTVVVVLSRHVATCIGSLRLGGVGAQKAARVRGTRVSFTWTVSASTPSGPAAVTVTCAHLGSASTAFRIVARAIPASAVVTKTGFSTWGGDQYRFVDWGAVITNNSPDQDAGNIQVTVNVLDASGKIIATDVQSVQNIQAGATFYMGGETDSSTANAPPASLQVTTLIGTAKAAHLLAMQATNVTFYPEPYGSGTDLQGQFSNPYTKTLSSLTKITFIAFDSSGNIIGGGRTYIDADVPPGGSLGFSGTIEGTNPAQVASISVSFDPWFK